MSHLALQLIKENKRTKDTFLDLGNCGLINELPKELFDCTWLEGLNLCDEYIDYDFFSDSNFYSKATNANITEEDTDVSTCISRNGGEANILEIIPLKGFDNLQNLKSLYLSAAKLKDLNFLENLINLKILQLGECETKDLKSPNLASLEFLMIGSSHFENGHFFKNLINLKVLIIADCRFEDLSFLKHLTKIETLALPDFEGSDFTFLEHLINVRDLIFYETSEISDLTSLRNLTKIETLALPTIEANNVDFLENLTAIKILVFAEDSRIDDLNSLKNLTKLETLVLQELEIKDISFLEGLMNLKTLSLGFNQISDLSLLPACINLEYLVLERNKINYFDETLLEHLKKLKFLSLNGNPITNIPEEIYNSDNCLEDVKNYFKDKKRNAALFYESKMILVGNGRVGKTCLIKRLVDNTFNPDENSTEAIQLRHWQLPELATNRGLEKIQINIWDFGGQDIYHATHRLFMNTTALFILVWDAKTERMPEQTDMLINGEKIIYKNYSLRYWLSYIKTESNNSSVIIVQTKRGKDGLVDPSLEREEMSEYVVKEKLAVECSLNTRNGFKALQEKIEEIIEEQVKVACTEIPAQWYHVKLKIEELQKREEKQLSITAFNEICREEDLNEDSSATLLRYLHNTGTFFYREGLFNNQIVIDQQWAISAVYMLFNSVRHGSKFKDGIFTTEDLEVVWKDYTDEERELFMTFMLQCETCFEITDQKFYNAEDFFNIRKYLAPQLLPDEKPDKLVAFAFDINEGVYFKYKHKFLHAAVILRFIVRVGFLADTSDMWKAGVLIKTIDGTALIEAYPERNEILVRIKNSNYSVLLTKIRNELNEITRYEKGIQESVSLNGLEYIQLENFKNHPKSNEEIQAENGLWVKLADYKKFLGPDEQIRFDIVKDKQILQAQQQNKPKIYFSYAWGGERERIVTELYDSLKADNEFVLVRDKVDLGYKDSVSEFESIIGTGDFVVVAISDKYLKSDNCMFELYELYRNNKLNKNALLEKIYPIRVEELNLDTPRVIGDYIRYWKNKEDEWASLVKELGSRIGTFQYTKSIRIENIGRHVADLISILSDINSMTTAMLSKDNFAEIKRAIKSKSLTLT